MSYAPLRDAFTEMIVSAQRAVLSDDLAGIPAARNRFLEVLRRAEEDLEELAAYRWKEKEGKRDA